MRCFVTSLTCQLCYCFYCCLLLCLSFPQHPGAKGVTGHYATFESAVHGFGSQKELALIRYVCIAPVQEESGSCLEWNGIARVWKDDVSYGLFLYVHYLVVTFECMTVFNAGKRPLKHERALRGLEGLRDSTLFSVRRNSSFTSLLASSFVRFASTCSAYAVLIFY